MAKNLCAKTRASDNPYEVWQSRDGSWTWLVLKKWQADDNKLFARWFCEVITPHVPDGEMGDCYVTDVKKYGNRQLTPDEVTTFVAKRAAKEA